MNRTPTLMIAALLFASPALAGKKKKETADEQPPAEQPPAEQPVADAAVNPSPADIYDYRHVAFEGMGRHMKALSMMVKGRAPVRTTDLVAHSQALHGASSYLVDMFPEGTGPDVVSETEALAGIWSDWEGFKAKAADFGVQSSLLIEVAETGDIDAFKIQFGEVGATCGGCHDHYRKGD